MPPRQFFDLNIIGSVESNISFMRNQMMISTYSSVQIYDIKYTVSQSDEVVVAVKSGLLGNYPNPFNPETTLDFYLKSEGFVNIDVFNTRGQKVKTLVNEIRPAGNNTVTWHGVDDNNRAVSSGIYFYRMTTSGYTSTSKMVLLK
jgi:flagellar hook assembly protein FlgD